MLEESWSPAQPWSGDLDLNLWADFHTQPRTYLITLILLHDLDSLLDTATVCESVLLWGWAQGSEAPDWPAVGFPWLALGSLVGITYRWGVAGPCYCYLDCWLVLAALSASVLLGCCGTLS